MIYITDAGLEKNSFEENLQYVYGRIKEEKGEDVDLSPTGPWGQFASMWAKFLSDNDDQQEEIYLSRDPDNATGVSQDKLSSETGTYRNGATKTVVQHVLLKGSEGTAIPGGKQAGLSAEFDVDDDLYFSLNDRVVVSRESARKIILSLDPVSTGAVYRITVNSENITYTALVGDTLAIVLAALIAELPTEVSGTDVDSQLQLFGDDVDFSLSFSATLAIEELWGAGDFTASITGAYSVSAESLTEIITPVSGWDAVSNPSTGITGEARESDTELIIRRRSELIKGKGTDSAIENALSNVDNVSSAAVASNRTRGEVDDVPANSFEAVVLGGLPDDIAQAIFDNMPAGIQPYGLGYSGTAYDDQGNSYTIAFSRPSVTYLWVRYTRTQHPEDAFPATGNSQIKGALLEWVADNIQQGTDIIRQQLEGPLFTVEGTYEVVTEIAETAGPTDTPVYVSENISIPDREKAEFDEDRIFILVAE